MKSHIERNKYMLRGSLKSKGYDWWWHNLTGYNSRTGEEKTFFIEYYICNPALGEDKPVLGQLPENKKNKKKPSYAMIKCGAWGKGAKQINNFYPINEFQAEKNELKLSIGNCTLSENMMEGKAYLSEEEAKNHPEYMSDAGSMEWKLKINKRIGYSVGYGASSIFRFLNAFEMFWHVQGMKTEYEGKIIFDGDVYDVIPEKSFGYADKNWGSNYTSPWLWVSSCNLKSNITGQTLSNSVFDFGGGRPKVFGIPLRRKLLGCFVYEGRRYEYNFSKFWQKSKIDFSFSEEDNINRWILKAKNRYSFIELEMTCKKEEMLFINYESPDGMKRHNRLWNGGTGEGRLKLYSINGKENELIDDISFYNAGCEYGEYGES